jgi:hypothetical protein
MPSKKDYKSQGDEMMMRAAWDVSRDLLDGYGVTSWLELRPTMRKGVYLIVAVALAEGVHWEECYRSTYSREWPRSEVMSLAAGKFAAMNHIYAQVESLIASGAWIDRRTRR